MGEQGGNTSQYAIFDIVPPARSVTLQDFAEQGQIGAIEDWWKKNRYKNADINSKDVTGRTALMCAAEAGQIGAAEKLISHGAQANVLDVHNRRNAVHLAAREGNLEVCKVLVNSVHNEEDRIAMLNHQDKHGFTPLYMAKTKNSQEVFEYLISVGASYSSKSATRRAAPAAAAEGAPADAPPPEGGAKP